ncbi:MAG: choice-of-anchor J domain-containing protein, partial [Anaerolineales bacterium]|nr:choice-of-anchor J domain-containing protein [Anaerolineales bacterium]
DGWTTYNLTPVSQGWQLVDAPVRTGETAFFHDDGFGTQDSWLVTPRFTPSSRSELIFWQYQRYPDSYGKHSLWVSTARQDPKDGDYVELVADLGAGDEQAWQEVTQALAEYAGQEIYVAFRYEGDFADEWGIDDVTVTSGGVWFESNSPLEVRQTTLVTGFVGSGSGVRYSWDFGNGDTAVGEVISYTYPTFGVYTITMTAENSVSQMTVTGTYTVTPIIQLIPIVVAGDGDTPFPFDEDEASAKPEAWRGKARPHTPPEPADLPIFNLTITSTAPTRIGQSTMITAVVQTGTNMTFTLNLGDGSPTQVLTASSPGFPPVVEHTYAAVGVYTVTVTAVNEVSNLTTTAPITITDYPIGEAIATYGFEMGEDLGDLGFHQMTPLGPGWQAITSTLAHAGERVLFHDDDFGLQDSWVVFPAVPIVDGSMLRFWQYTNYRPEYEKHSLWYSSGSPDPKDKDFVEIMELLPAPEDTWEKVEIDLAALAGQDVYLALRYEGDFADEWLLDEIEFRTDLRAENDSPTHLGQVT